MKCGVCGKEERIVFKSGGYRGDPRDAEGNRIPETTADGTVETRFMYDLGAVNVHKRLEHPEEFKAAEEAKVARKTAKETRRRVEASHTRAVSHAAGKAVAVPVINYQEYWMNKKRGLGQDGPYMVGLSHEYVHESSEQLQDRIATWGKISPSDFQMRETRQITEDQASDLQTLDAEIDRLKAERTVLAKQIFDASSMLTNQEIMDVAKARERALFELNQMLDEDEGLPAEEKVLVGPSDQMGDLTALDVENILERTMGNHPAAFIAISEEEIADALSAYGYTASSEVVRNGGHQRSA